MENYQTLNGAAESNTSRTLYVVLGLLTGSLGIHNFYAKRIAPAVGQLVLTIGAVVGDGIWAEDHAGRERFRSLSGRGADGVSHYQTEPFHHLPLYAAAVILFVWIVWEIVKVSRDGNGGQMR